MEASNLPVPLGAPTPITVKFDCSANPPQSGTITLVGSAPRVAYTQTVTVTVTLAAK